MTNLFEFNKELYEKDIEDKGEKKTIKLMRILIKDKKYDEINLAVENEEYLHQLYKKYQIES